MKSKGIENTAALLGGFAAWQKAGLPVATNK
jgi:rhodanese-related sulfurtransferase